MTMARETIERTDFMSLVKEPQLKCFEILSTGRVFNNLTELRGAELSGAVGLDKSREATGM